MVEIVDGIKVYDGTAYFGDWLEGMQYGVSSVNELKEDLLHNQEVEPEHLQAAIEEIEQDFFDWCEEHNIGGALE